MLASAIEGDLPDCVVCELLAQLIAEETPVLNKIEQRARMSILSFFLSGDGSAERCTRHIDRPAVVLAADHRGAQGALGLVVVQWQLRQVLVAGQPVPFVAAWR